MNYMSDMQLLVRCHLKLGDWQLNMADSRLSEEVIRPVLDTYSTATSLSDTHYKAWHSWAIMNFQVAEHYLAEKKEASVVAAYLAAALKAFFHSVTLGQGRATGEVLQDLLRLLTLWFTHGAMPAVHAVLESGLNSVRVSTWLQVIPQLIARIHVPTTQIRNMLYNLLARVGRHHPQVQQSVGAFEGCLCCSAMM